MKKKKQFILNWAVKIYLNGLRPIAFRNHLLLALLALPSHQHYLLECPNVSPLAKIFQKEMGKKLKIGKI